MKAAVKNTCCLLIILLTGLIANAQTNQLIVSENSAVNSFRLSDAAIYYDSLDAAVVKIAVEAFANDIKLVTERDVTISRGRQLKGNNIVLAGTIGSSAILDQLIKTKKINVSAIRGKWERFSITILSNPFPGVKKMLVIAGSDRRGTAYGIFHLSRMMGVSPFYWWADVIPAKKKHIFIAGSYTSNSPSVKYRGIFINDEDWGLQPWAAKNMDTAVKDIGPNTYTKIFELLLRLKANYIWPAMHPCTKAFYYYKDNPKIADEYAIIVGGSHCEPMLRNNVFEWAENFEHEYGKKPGEWRYDLNKDEMYKYWNDRVGEAVNYESVYTVGMRGIHDGSMPGPNDPDQKMKLLQKVIEDQRKILNYNFKKPASEVPQIFVPYKEVLSLYRRGLQLDDDITIVWPDDNHGYIRQLPDAQERKRSGGHGVYYHLSYWGSPHDYLWLSSISPVLINYEMTKAFYYGADRLWVFNVGDIKPAEAEIQFCMDMAWDIQRWNPRNMYKYTEVWAEEIFGSRLAGDISVIKSEYYELAQSSKPEHLGMVNFSSTEINERLERYAAIAYVAKKLVESVPQHLKDAYFELVLYPVVNAFLMNEKIFYEKTGQYDRAVTAFDSIRLLTGQYNKKIADGKWDGMMSYHPRDLKIFNPPARDVNPVTQDEDKPLLTLAANSFNSKKESPQKKIKAVYGLGIDGKGVTVFHDKPSAWPDMLPADSLYTSYDISLEPGKYAVVVKCLPDYDVGKSKQLRYGIAMNEEKPQWVNVYAETESAAWKENVVRGYSSGETIHTVDKNGKTQLRIYFKDPNLVINTIEIYKQPQ